MVNFSQTTRSKKNSLVISNRAGFFIWHESEGFFRNHPLLSSSDKNCFRQSRLKNGYSNLYQSTLRSTFRTLRTMDFGHF